MIFEYFYKRPYLLYAVIAGFFIVGVIALVEMPKNLFPDANPPQVIVITKMPGATAQVIANTVSKPIEQEISRLGLITDISSTNVANFSIVKAEFGYKKTLNAAAVDVANALSIAKGKLPPHANPAVYTAGDFTLPVDIISLSPKNDSLSLADIRKITDNFIKPSLLSNKKIGNVEVFGGYQSSINIEVDPFKAKRYGVDFDKIAKSLATLNRDMPLGFVKNSNSFYTITFYGEKDDVERVKQLPILPNVRIGDIADVEWGYVKRTSGYIGNGKSSIAVAIQRAPQGSVLDVSNEARSEMKKLELLYPNITFEISDTQRDLVQLSNKNMLEALRDAIILTLLVIMFFLGNFRAIVAAAISIPMVFFATLSIVWLTGSSLNLIIYTAIILALGLLTDDAVVVLENIERHLTELKEDLQTAIKSGTKEVVAPVFSGTVATIAILFPLMYIGGFPEKIFKPMIFTLIVALLISFFLAITFIPKLAEFMYRNGVEKSKVDRLFEVLYQKTVGRLIVPYVGIIRYSNGRRKAVRRILLIGGVLVLLAVSVRGIMPVIGRDAMPPMDTGIIKAQLAFSANETVDSSEKKLLPFLQWLHKQPWVIRSSVAFGSEMGILSLGSGNLPTEATITVNCVDRFSRKQTIWEIEDRLRKKLSTLEGVKKIDVFDFGATSVSSIKASLVTRLKSPLVDGLAQKAKAAEQKIRTVKGLTSVSRSWDKDMTEIVLDIDENKALSYGITPYKIVMQIPIKGQIISLNANLQSLDTQAVRLYMKGKFSQNEQTLRLLPIKTKFGNIPLETVATISKRLTYAKIEREGMLYSLDINGYRSKRPISHLTSDAEVALTQTKMDNRDIVFSQEGDIAQIKDSFHRMTKAIGLGIILLIMVLIAIYKSVRMAIIMIMVLPLSMIGAAWGMLVFSKPSCMPSMLGILLLFGIIIKNAVLLIDFYQHHRAMGSSPFDSAVKSVTVRFRPVMMTAFGTIAGMLPIAFERAVGLERLSPLADVTVGGLLVGTLLTLVYIPMLAYMSEKNDAGAKNE